jgi:hypothetical protein
MLPAKLVRSTFALLALSASAMFVAPPADAQYDAVKTKKRTGGVTEATAPAAPTSVGAATNPAASAAVNPDIVALLSTSDLIIKDLGFDGKGDITFELRNRGKVPINPAPVSGPEGKKAVPPVPESQQIKVMVYLNNAPHGTVFQPRLGGQTSKTFTVAVSPNLKPGCGESRPLRTVIDPSNVIAEYTDTNNVDTVTAARPCPDLAIKSITKNENEWGTEFVARVTIINQGNAPSDKFDYLAKEGFGGSIADLGDLDDDVGGPLAPGETMKFNVGSARAHQNLHVEVFLDRHRRVEELDENNNYKKKTVN